LNVLNQLVTDSTDAIINEIGPQILDSFSREQIENKVVEIVNSGKMNVSEIIQIFMEQDDQVKCRVQ